MLIAGQDFLWIVQSAIQNIKNLTRIFGWAKCNIWQSIESTNQSKE